MWNLLLTSWPYWVILILLYSEHYTTCSEQGSSYHNYSFSVLREWLIMRHSPHYGTLIFREFRRTNEGIRLTQHHLDVPSCLLRFRVFWARLQSKFSDGFNRSDSIIGTWVPRLHSNCSNDVSFTHSEWLTSTFFHTVWYGTFNIALKPAHSGSSPPFGDTISRPYSITPSSTVQYTRWLNISSIIVTTAATLRTIFIVTLGRNVVLLMIGLRS